VQHPPDFPYEVSQILATGTFGTVCVAKQRTSGRTVALKVLKQEHLSNPKVARRMRDEALMLSQLRHPNIVHVTALHELDGRPVIEMEWVEGADVQETLFQLEQGLSTSDAVMIVSSIALALHAAFTRPLGESATSLRMIHRDVKPSNIMLSFDGCPKLTDFGTARGRFDGRESETVSMVLGARPYLAPERLDGADDGPPGDVYALGQVFRELLGGAAMAISLHPYHHKQMLDEAVTALPLGDISKDGKTALRRLLSRMCSYVPEERPSCAQVVSRLRQLAARERFNAELGEQTLAAVRAAADLRSSVLLDEHPAVGEIAFLCPERAQRFEPAINQKIRTFLAQPNWLSERAHLETLLEHDAHWTAAPVLEALGASSGGMWRRMFGGEPEAEHVLAILSILEQRTSENVLVRVSSLLSHKNERIRAASKAFLDKHSGH